MRARLIACFLCLAAATPLHADPQGRAPGDRGDLGQTVPPHPLPPDSTTDHVLTVPGRTLHFKATAGAVRLSDAGSGSPIADIATVAYRLDGVDGSKRPLTVVINGGPGAASAWLDLGAVGPWRLPVDSAAISPAMPVAVVDNADTWLDFTDLLFIDPLGTGYSRALGKGDDAGKAFYSVEGDIGSLATVVRKWLVANDRLGSPHFILGESYGGFRAPKLARKLEESEGVGVAGILMLSPVLDFGRFENRDDPAVIAGHFPSLVAAARGIKGEDPRAKLKDAEDYAANGYLVDLFKGKRDADAVRQNRIRAIPASPRSRPAQRCPVAHRDHQLEFEALVSELTSSVFILIDRIEDCDADSDLDSGGADVSHQLLPYLMGLATDAEHVSVIVTSTYLPPEGLIKEEELRYFYRDTRKSRGKREG